MCFREQISFNKLMVNSDSLMVKIKKVRQAGIWCIAGITLLTLLILNVRHAYAYVDGVVIGALIVLILWLIAMAIISSRCRRH